MEFRDGVYTTAIVAPAEGPLAYRILPWDGANAASVDYTVPVAGAVPTGQAQSGVPWVVVALLGVALVAVSARDLLRWAARRRRPPREEGRP